MHYITNQVSSSTPLTSPDITFGIIDSPSIKIVFCISDTVLLTISHFAISFESSLNVFFRPPPRAPITIGITVTPYPGCLSLISNASCQYFVNFSALFVSKLCCCKQAMSHIQMRFSSLSSSIKSGSPSCCGFSDVTFKIPNQFGFPIL